MEYAPFISSDCVNIVLQNKDDECITYTLGGRCPCCYGVPYQIPSTISPVLVKTYKLQDPLDKDLNNPEPGTDVFPHEQLWGRLINGDRIEFRLTDGINRTNDTVLIQNIKDLQGDMFDGINQNNKAVFVINNSKNYQLFVCTQSKERGQHTKNVIIDNMSGEGNVISLMLEHTRNRVIWTVDNGTYRLCIKDIPAYDVPYFGNLTLVAELKVKWLFVKTVSLGNDTYLGITDKGLLYCFWLDKTKKIWHKQQKCSKLFKQIAVDNTVITEKGFYPKIAFLTDTGEVYITHLTEYNQPTLLYLTTIQNASEVEHFFYNNGKLLVVYDMGVIREYKDNFDFLYGCSLLKKHTKRCMGTGI